MWPKSCTSGEPPRAQPALSRQIRALEDEVKAALFVRDRRTTVLAAAGEQLLADARDLLAVAEAVHRRVTAVAEAKPVLRGTDPSALAKNRWWAARPPFPISAPTT